MMANIVYQSLGALVPVRKVLDEAGAALADRGRILLTSGVPEVLGAVAGVGAGTAAGALIISTGAASGVTGAASLTSGLAAAGSIIGGGMLAGVSVVAAPAVVLGVCGYAAVTYLNKTRLDRERRALLQEAVKKHEAVLREQKAENASNRERVDYLRALLIKLEEIIGNLRGDLYEQPI